MEGIRSGIGDAIIIGDRGMQCRLRVADFKQRERNMTDISIANAQPRDVPELVYLMQQYWDFERIRGFQPEGVAALLQRFMAQPQHGGCWLASRGAETLGYLLCCNLFSFEHGGLIGVIDELYVLPTSQGTGIGKALVTHAEVAMRERGCVLIEMEVAEKNFRAQQFYSLLGFATRGGYSMMHKRLIG
jgi:ribosomal protein S18 acetylase RimI-like enzyme